MGHSAGFSYALWAIMQDFVMHYEPQHRILLYAMDRGAGFCYVLWAIAQDLVMRFGPYRQTNYHGSEPRQFLKILPNPLKG